MHKKVFSVICALLVSTSFNVSSSFAQNNQTFFSDVLSNHWAINQINKFYQKEIIGGYEDNTFRPNNFVTRAEFVKILNKAFDIDYIKPNVNVEFIDIKNHWAENDIKMAVSNGIYDYVLDSTLNDNFDFRPDDFITREEASTMIATYLDIKDSKVDKLNKFEDSSEVSYWAKTSVEALVEKNLIKGYSNNTINPKGNLTRSELVVLVDRISSITKDYAQKIPVLMYHHFEEEQSEFGAVVKKEEFLKQMDYLKANGYNTITVKELYEIYIGEKLLPKNPVLITADDGYLSNYDFMFEELKKRNMEATIFVLGSNIDNADYKNSHSIGLKYFNWTQAKEMVDSKLIDIQSHTYNSHTKVQNSEFSYEKGDFSTNTNEETKEEYKQRIDKDIKQSIQGIKENLGYTPVALAYPFGEHSEISEQVLKENGIKMSFLIRNTSVDLNNLEDELYLLNRITVSGKDSFEDFKKNLQK